jgi:hypothetical protein
MLKKENITHFVFIPPPIDNDQTKSKALLIFSSFFHQYFILGYSNTCGVEKLTTTNVFILTYKVNIPQFSSYYWWSTFSNC